MQTIPSFQKDHDSLQKGLYSLTDANGITTFDLRFKTPNAGDYITPKALHTIEHLMATVLRNGREKDNIVYFGPMGCRTGFYFLTRSLSDSYCIQLIKDAFAFIADFWGSIPGAAMSECGNWRDHNLLQAKEDAKQFLEIIQDWTKDDLKYPTKDEN